MASTARPALLRQTAAASRSMAPSTRAGPSMLSKSLMRPSTQSSPKLSIVQATAFHASSRRNLLPPGPQIIRGSVNEPAPVPDPSPSHGHYHWTFERGMAAALVPLSIAPFAAGSLNPTLDALLATTLLVHSHMGVQAIIIDYVPKKRYANLRRASHWLLNAATILAGIGLYEFETTDVGLVEATKRLWRA
ncbi:hypothetical protein INS49_002097 [Diaporthe citri]|uniref:uncharacterized protein n=1 Tax=Diaporthe citri TaxID=83186 RepID=UPI001C7F2522|nr:uncharacterized protein INS49_002097 [Diaporthe citri]KAG6367898.1 hypothetical protein INS49_002097 [Diaporthe citri]